MHPIHSPENIEDIRNVLPRMIWKETSKTGSNCPKPLTKGYHSAFGIWNYQQVVT